jgi:hypothetical protein
MPRLVPNPIGELMNPLQRIEGAITSLAERLRPVDSLPSVHAELEQVNRALESMLIVLEEIRDELVRQGPAGVGRAVAKRRPAA